MRRSTGCWLALFCVTVFSAARDAEAAQRPPLRVAAFQSDVTPPLGGHPLIWLTPVETVEDPLLAKGVVLDNGAGRYVVCAVDWCGLCNSSHRLFCEKIARAAGCPVEHVAVHTIHQHTAPYTDGDAQTLIASFKDIPLYVDFKFLDEVTDRLAVAVKESLREFQVFDSVGTGEAKVDRVASSRRIPKGDGTVITRMSAGAADPKLAALPEGLIDPMLKTITLARSSKPLVRIHYYATHPQSFYGDPRASSDVPGFARRRLEEKERVFQIYFTGCSGNVTLGKYNNRTPEARAELTDRLYAAMEASVAATRYSPAERIAWHTLPLRLAPRTDPGYTEADKRAEMSDPKVAPIRRVTSATAVAYAMRADQPLQLSLLEIGPAAILHLPGESFVEFQLYAQQLRPGGFVAVAAYGDCATGYICTEKAFPEGGYEPTASHVAPQSEKLMKEAIRELLTGE